MGGKIRIALEKPLEYRFFVWARDQPQESSRVLEGRVSEAHPADPLIGFSGGGHCAIVHRENGISGDKRRRVSIFSKAEMNDVEKRVSPRFAEKSRDERSLLTGGRGAQALGQRVFIFASGRFGGRGRVRWNRMEMGFRRQDVSDLARVAPGVGRRYKTFVDLEKIQFLPRWVESHEYAKHGPRGLPSGEGQADTAAVGGERADLFVKPTRGGAGALGFVRGDDNLGNGGHGCGSYQPP